MESDHNCLISEYDEDSSTSRNHCIYTIANDSSLSDASSSLSIPRRSMFTSSILSYVFDQNSIRQLLSSDQRDEDGGEVFSSVTIINSLDRPSEISDSLSTIYSYDNFVNQCNNNNSTSIAMIQNISNSTENGCVSHNDTFSTSQDSHHKLTSFINVCRHLQITSNNNTRIKPSSINTTAHEVEGPYEKYDWNHIQNMSEEVLQILELQKDQNDPKNTQGCYYWLKDYIKTFEKEKKLLPLIPPLPPYSLHNVHEIMNENEEWYQHEIQLIFPQEFICQLCKDFIIGAIVLDCSCKNSTYCISCLEKYHLSLIQKEKVLKNDADHVTKSFNDDYDDDDFVIVDTIEEEKNSTLEDTLSVNFSLDKSMTTWKNGINNALHMCQEGTCPSCDSLYHHAIPCHAMDVAIYNTLINITDSKLQIPLYLSTVLQSRFLHRLVSWREEVIRRHEELARFQDHNRQALLSKLIEEEELVLRQVQDECKEKGQGCNPMTSCFNNNHKWYLWSMVATVTAAIVMGKKH